MIKGSSCTCSLQCCVCLFWFMLLSLHHPNYNDELLKLVKQKQLVFASGFCPEGPQPLSPPPPPASALLLGKYPQSFASSYPDPALGCTRVRRTLHFGECTRAWLSKGAGEWEPHFRLELCIHLWSLAGPSACTAFGC